MEIIKLNAYDLWEIDNLDVKILKKEIAKRGIKKSWLAKEADITPAQLSYILSESNPSKKNKAKLFLALKKLGIPFLSAKS